MDSDTREIAFDYHDRSKHHYFRYARSCGFMDWDTQPRTIQIFDQSPSHRLTSVLSIPAICHSLVSNRWRVLVTKVTEFARCPGRCWASGALFGKQEQRR